MLTCKANLYSFCSASLLEDSEGKSSLMRYFIALNVTLDLWT